MAATMPRGWTRPLADRLHELADGRSWELISRIASRKLGPWICGCGDHHVEEIAECPDCRDPRPRITKYQVRCLFDAPSTLNPLVVEGVRRAVGMSEAEAARLQREGESG